MKSKLTAIVILAIMLGSCASYQKKLNKFQTFALNNPAELAKLCTEKFPVKEVIKPGRVDTVPGKTVFLPGKTIYLKGDSVKCPDQSVQCPSSTIAQPDTVYREDTAKTFEALYKAEKARDSLNLMKGQLKTTKENLEASEDSNSTKIWTIAVLIVIIGVGVVLKIKGIF